MFVAWKRERLIRKVLKRLAKQRVVTILQPGNVWVLENTVREDKQTAPALRTCHLRGWIEPVVDSIPMAELTETGELPDKPSGTAPVYRLTEGGWNVINRSHEWVLLSAFIAIASMVATVVGLIVSGLNLR